MKQYCTQGHATEYTLNKPKFCSQCGQSFESMVVKPLNIAPPNFVHTHPPRLVTSNINDEEEKLDELIQTIHEVSVELEPRRQTKVTLGAIGMSKPSSDKFSRSSKKLSKKDQKAQIDNFLKETQSVNRTNSINVGGEG